MADSLKAHVDISAKGAEQFVELYYKVFDTQRTVLNRLYRDSSSILWNGNPFAGVQPFTEFFNKLPTSESTVLSYGCHPLPSQTAGQNSIIVTVTGNVKYSNENTPRLFEQVFTLSPDPVNGSYYVWADCFRFI